MWLQKSVRIRGSVELINIIHSDGLANSLSLPSIYILYIAVELNLNALISSHLLRTRSAIQRPVSVLYAINMTYLPALKISQTKVELMRYLHLSPSIYVLMAVCRAAFRTRSLVAVPRPLNSDLLTFTTTSGRDSSSLHLADLGEVAPERSLHTEATPYYRDASIAFCQHCRERTRQWLSCLIFGVLGGVVGSVA